MQITSSVVDMAHLFEDPTHRRVPRPLAPSPMSLRSLLLLSLLSLTPIAGQAQVTARFYNGIPTTAPGLGGSFGGLTAFCTVDIPSIQFVDRAAFTSFVTTNCAGRPAGFDGFSFGARFTGSLTASAAATYTFTGTADDGNSFWINGANARSSWGDQSGTYAFTAPLTATPNNAFQIDYYANSFGLSFFTVDLPNGVRYSTPTTVVPEPGSFALIGVGLAVLALRRRPRAG